ncbi:MAG: hypothetical protein NZ534_13205, partial [Bacteroidia bacterium]|nr:hypothetical protein [Bacteroidia bacterium]
MRRIATIMIIVTLGPTAYRCAQAQAVVAECEYWFDDRYAQRQNISINAPATSFDFESHLPLAGLNHGFHRLHMRFRDSQGRYSPVQTTT